MQLRLPMLPLMIVFIFAAASGCAPHEDLIRGSSSAPFTEVIETVKDSQQTAEKTPLALPAAVAIIFVPSNDNARVPDTTLLKAADQLKQQLLANPKFIKSVAVISGDELSKKISLERIRALYASDIAILLSYQQDQRSAQYSLAALADVTIVSHFLLPGVKTKTSTVIDGKVIHIPNNALIFRANGKDERSTHSSVFSEKSTAVEEAIQGLLAATTDFGNSLLQTMAKFENYDMPKAVSMSIVTEGVPTETGKVKKSNDYWTNVNSIKSTGGGAFGLFSLLISVAIGWLSWRRR